MSAGTRGIPRREDRVARAEMAGCVWLRPSILKMDLVALALSAVVIGLDVTVLNLALPTLASKLHASSGDL